MHDAKYDCIDEIQPVFKNLESTDQEVAVQMLCNYINFLDTPEKKGIFLQKDI